MYGSNDLTSWERILYGQKVKFGQISWETGIDGWSSTRIDKFDAIRYIKLVKKEPAALMANSILEFQYKSDLQYGYYVSGHKLNCDYCHDTAGIHVDGVSQTYRAELNNYTAGYRLADIMIDGQSVPALEVPRVGINNKENPKHSNDFALCFTCHDKYNLLGDSYGTAGFYKNPLQTDFRNDARFDGNANQINQHLLHLRGRGKDGNSPDWDSDWNGTVDSPISCTACHNVHGSPNPAMTRHGELASTTGTSDKVPMFNFFFKNQSGRVDTELKEVLDSIGGKTQYFSGGAGEPAKNNTCKMCHNDSVNYDRTPY